MLNDTFRVQTMIPGDLLQFVLLDAETKSQLALCGELTE